jgi:hypothetical protein
MLVGEWRAARKKATMKREQLKGATRTGDADVVSEDEAAGGGDDAGEEHEHGELAGVVLAPSGVHHRAAGHPDLRQLATSRVHQQKNGRRSQLKDRNRDNSNAYDQEAEAPRREISAMHRWEAEGD